MGIFPKQEGVVDKLQIDPSPLGLDGSGDNDVAVKKGDQQHLQARKKSSLHTHVGRREGGRESSTIP